METKIIEIQQTEGIFSKKEEKDLHLAGEIIKKGGLVAFPTETVYGLGSDALNPESCKKIYTAKGRPSDNPLIIHICKWEDIYLIAEKVCEEAKKLADAFWPGPLTMIFPKSEKVPYETTGGLDTVAVRMPSNIIAQKLIEYGGGYVAAPSANISGKPSPTIAKYVIEDMMGRIDMIIDGGEGKIGLESTILDLTISPPEILRPGYITKEMLEKVIGQVNIAYTGLNADTAFIPRSPGMKYKHYAPKGELTIVQGNREAVIAYINSQCTKDREAGEKTGIIGTDEILDKYCADMIKSAGSREDEECIAKHLYTILREFDDENVTKIYSESFGENGLRQAIMNRLLKAAGYKVVSV